MKIITHDFGKGGQQFSLWGVLQNTDEKTLQHLVPLVTEQTLSCPTAVQSSALSLSTAIPSQPKAYLSEESGSSSNGKTLHDLE